MMSLETNPSSQFLLVSNVVQNLSFLGKKFCSFKIQKDLIRHTFSRYEAWRWRIYMPFVVNFQDIHKRRVRFLQSWQMVMPERMQQLGVYLYPGVDAVMWDRIVPDLPTIVPRGFEFHSRYF